MQFTPQWIGKLEETIHMAHVSSVKIDTGILFSDVLIETSGGSHPIRCHGHRKSDAVRMKALIERYQTDYYRRPCRGIGPVRPITLSATMDDLTFSAQTRNRGRVSQNGRAAGSGYTVSHAGAVAPPGRHPPLSELPARTKASTSRR